MGYIKIYTIAYVKKLKTLRFTIHSVEPKAQLWFKSRFPKIDKHTEGKWLIHDTKRHKDI